MSSLFQLCLFPFQHLTSLALCTSIETRLCWESLSIRKKSQLNGAEMPWGATLSVELASTDYNKKKRTEDSTSTTAISCLSRTMISDGTDDGETILDPKDDLETFFSELEQE